MADLNKIVDDLSALTILEAAELKKMLEEKWGVTASAGVPMMMGAMAAAPAAAVAEEPQEEQTEFAVVLVDVGPKKINVIKAVRAVTTLGLAEAKALVESDKPVVVEGVSKEVANDAKAKLEAEGAKVEVK